jgi:AmmeMemoRadiSam system protein A
LIPFKGGTLMRKAYLVPHPPLIIPGIGDGSEIAATRAAYEAIADEVSFQKPDTVIIATPHGVSYSDYIQVSPGSQAGGDFGDFHQKAIRFQVQYDIPLARKIEELAQKEGIRAGTLGEKDVPLDHGVMVPLYFLKSTRIVRISISGLPLVDHYRLGMCVAKASESANVVFIASGDMSHKLTSSGPYGYAPEGKLHDEYIARCIRNADFPALLAVDPLLREKAAECGDRSLCMLAGFLDGFKVESRVLSYEGPFGVGYLTATFSGSTPVESCLPVILADQAKKLTALREREDPYVHLARENIEAYVRTGKPIQLPNGLPAEMLQEKAGVFVSIHKEEDLRGCIGTLEPQEPTIAHEILTNSISAATKDPRFPPVTDSELDTLTYNVDVLSPSEPVSGKEELDVKRYGVIVAYKSRRGVLLPNLEGVNTVEQQIQIALQKAGIRPDESYSMRRFEVTRHL